MNSVSNLACACQNKAIALAGWFSGIGKAIGGAIGAAIGGPVGAAIGGYVGARIDELIAGTKPQWNQFPTPGGGNISMWGGSKAENLIEELNDIELQNKYKKWIDEKFLPWAKNYFKKINGSYDSSYLKSKKYKKEINEVLTNLNALRVYYKAEQQKVGFRGLGSIDIDEAIHESKTREELMMILIEAVTKSYAKVLKDKGFKVPRLVANQINVKDINVNSPEELDWSGITASVEIKLFEVQSSNDLSIVRDPSKNINQDDKEISSPIVDEDKQETAQMLEEELNSSSIVAEERQNAGLKIFGFVAISSVIYYWWQNKKKVSK